MRRRGGAQAVSRDVLHGPRGEHLTSHVRVWYSPPCVCSPSVTREAEGARAHFHASSSHLWDRGAKQLPLTSWQNVHHLDLDGGDPCVLEEVFAARGKGQKVHKHRDDGGSPPRKETLGRPRPSTQLMLQPDSATAPTRHPHEVMNWFSLSAPPPAACYRQR